MPLRPQRTRVSAYGIITRDDEMLLCRISNQLPQFAGQWTLPGGGIDFGETPKGATVREVEEETGLLVTVDELVHVDSILIDTPDADFHGIRIIYRATPVGGQLRNEIGGTTDLCQWWSRADLPDMVDIAITGARFAFS